MSPLQFAMLLKSRTNSHQTSPLIPRRSKIASALAGVEPRLSPRMDRAVQSSNSKYDATGIGKNPLSLARHPFPLQHAPITSRNSSIASGAKCASRARRSLGFCWLSSNSVGSSASPFPSLRTGQHQLVMVAPCSYEMFRRLRAESDEIYEKLEAASRCTAGQCPNGNAFAPAI